ncbi:DUF6188 family protein [Streptomyces sp. NPDC058412]|uniref:DUF6188 family protein n=1 Tax=Streptomyces sp. NPDC058412 TaxID=3346486 RepID=UPI00366337E8
MGVARICIDFRLALTLDDGWEVVLEAPAQLSSGSLLTNPGLPLTPEAQDVAAALPLFGAKVLSAVAFKSGDLRMVFDSGMHLNCSADPSFEAWQISGPRGWHFVAQPGGDLAVWSPTAACLTRRFWRGGRLYMRRRPAGGGSGRASLVCVLVV